MSTDVKPLEASGTPHRWGVTRATFLTYFFDSYDLAILAVAMPLLLVDLNINKAQGGLLSSATMIGAAIGSMLFGLIAENFGRRRAIEIALVWFGLATLGIYAITTFLPWLILRFVAGIAIGGVWGPCVALISEHWHPRYVARASAFMLSTFAIGWIAASVVGRFALDVDWRLLFAFGGLAIPLALYVHFAVPADPAPRARRAGADRKSEPPAERIRLAEIFSPENRRRTILATLVNVCQMGGFWGIGMWVPTFLQEERGLDPVKMTNFLMVMYIGMFFGYQIFGYLADRIGRRRTILLCFVIDCVTVPVYLLVMNPTFLFWFGPVMGLSFGGVFGVTGSFYAELFPKRIRALASGFCFNVGRLGAVVAPYTVGLIGGQFGLKWGILCSPVVFALGIIAVLGLPETLRAPEKPLAVPDAVPA